MKEPNLPVWAELITAGRIKIHASKMYPEMLKRLKCEEKDQYWLTMALECAKLEVRHSLIGTSGLPKEGAALVILVVDADKDAGTWKLADSPLGRMATIKKNSGVYASEVKANFRRINPGAV